MKEFPDWHLCDWAKPALLVWNARHLYVTGSCDDRLKE